MPGAAELVPHASSGDVAVLDARLAESCPARLAVVGGTAVPEETRATAVANPPMATYCGGSRVQGTTTDARMGETYVPSSSRGFFRI